MGSEMCIRDSQVGAHPPLRGHCGQNETEEQKHTPPRLTVYREKTAQPHNLQIWGIFNRIQNSHMLQQSCIDANRVTEFCHQCLVFSQADSQPIFRMVDSNTSLERDNQKNNTWWRWRPAASPWFPTIFTETGPLVRRICLS